MNKGILLKLFFMASALVVVVMILITAAKTDFNGATSRMAMPKTYFEQFFVAGGPVVWFVLLPMSIITVYLATEYCLVIRRKKLLPDDICGTIADITRQAVSTSSPQAGLAQLPGRLAEKGDFISVAVSGAVSRCGGDLSRMRSMVIESLQEQAMALLRRIEWMNIMGNVSPMVGLFGTVLGIIKMFNAMAAVGGQPHPSQLAGGISIALVTTLWGLMIAIPALTIHGVFQNRIEMLASESAEQAEKTLSQIAYILREQKRTEQSKSGSGQPIVEIPPKSGGTIRTSTLSS
jgi:biopolymer transport protein ExbB